MAALLRSRGATVFEETIFENRYRHVDELARMGANVKVESNVAVISGVNRLTGADVSAPDLRAGAALVLAGLAADGYTVVDETKYILRGDVRFDEKLRLLGACIYQAEDEKDVRRFKLEAV